ncbi:MAG TPA: dienelactone hydrolase family protein [Acidimicrobiales bacterium]|nr:dienelactone hydrolase family protein [Acidimicrobiales bacterium]
MTALPEPAAGDPAPRGREAAAPSIAWLDEDLVREGVRQRRFDLTRGGRLVPGILWTPPDGEGPCPLVLLGHGGSGSKRQDYVVNMARRLVRGHGMAAAAIDGPVHGDRRTGPPAPPPLVLAEFAQLWTNDGDAVTDAMVADWEATLDALQSLPDVGSGPVGWWGISMGTIFGLPVVAADARIRAAVLGLMGLTGPTRARVAADAPAVRCPVLYLVQWDDRLFPHDTAIALWEALGSPEKRLLAHPGDHGDLPQDAFGASARFLARHLLGPRRTR